MFSRIAHQRILIVRNRNFVLPKVFDEPSLQTWSPKRDKNQSAERYKKYRISAFPKTLDKEKIYYDIDKAVNKLYS